MRLLAPHDYAGAADFTVRVTVTDRRGASTTESGALRIVP